MKNEYLFDELLDRLGEGFGNYLGYACVLVLMAHHDNEIGYNDLINILEKVISQNMIVIPPYWHTNCTRRHATYDKKTILQPMFLSAYSTIEKWENQPGII